MILYNIHTHTQNFSQIEGCDVINIINTYPLEFESLKQQSSVNLFSCGIHPWYSENVDVQIVKLTELLDTEKSIIAVGEAGLDKLKGLNLEDQIEIFKMQVELSEYVQKPMIVHCVKAWQEIVKLKKEIRPKQKWIIHGFRGGVDLARQLILQGFSISMGNFFNEAAAKVIPESVLFLETDDVDISIMSIYQSMSVVLRQSVDDVADIIANNVRNTFKLM